MNQISISPCSPVVGSIRPPGSKSITNRALVCAALARGHSTLIGSLESDDTQRMAESLDRLGVSVDCNTRLERMSILGCAGRLPNESADLFVGNSGTTIRFLTAVTALGHGRYRLDGAPRMRERPMRDLLEALNQLGTRSISVNQAGCPPVVVESSGLPGGTATVRGDISSQFLSGLLMVSPYADKDVMIHVDGPLVSRPYVQMTVDVMKAFGVAVDHDKLTCFRIAGRQTYDARRYEIEPDASAASYFWAAAAITKGRVRINGLARSSLQGDVNFCDCLDRMGCEVEEASDGITVVGHSLHGIDVDMNEISDTVQTLAAVALFADGPTTMRGISHIRHKETDRIGDLAQELRKLGAQVEELHDGMRIIPGDLRGTDIDTYNDHRMAMSLSLVGLNVAGVVINDPECTAKTYPRFFQDLKELTRG